MQQYLDNLRYILDNGEKRSCRTGTGTIGVFGMQSRYDLRQGFPAVTTKRLAWRAMLSELLWFIEGSGDERRLAEILHGTRDPAKKTIWTANAEAEYWKPKARHEGDLGNIYGVMWRSWPNARGTVDQLQRLIDGIQRDPYSRRHILTAWNPGELDQMALPPCHIMSQFYVSKRGELSCQMYQRSGDWFLGIPFNIASYSLLTHMIAQVCGLSVGEFIHTVGDAHCYVNHLEQIKTQLGRSPLPLPTLWLNPNVKEITGFTMNDIKLIDYTSHGGLPAQMAV